MFSFRLSGNQRRHRAVERVGDGPQEFRLHSLDDTVGGDRLSAGIQDVLLDLRHGLAQPVQGRVQLPQLAFGRRQEAQLDLRGIAERLRALPEGVGGLVRLILAEVSQSREQDGAIRRQRLERVILDERLACRGEMRFEMAQDYAIVQGVSLLIVIVVLFANLIVDLSYGWLDPRIRYA